MFQEEQESVDNFGLTSFVFEERNVIDTLEMFDGPIKQINHLVDDVIADYWKHGER